ANPANVVNPADDANSAKATNLAVAPTANLANAANVGNPADDANSANAVAAAADDDGRAASDATLSYQEINLRANRLAHHLRMLGVGPGIRVGLALDRPADLLLAMFAVGKSGGAYVPLDLSQPRERLALILEDARPLLLLTEESRRDLLLDSLPETLPGSPPAALLCLDAARDLLLLQPDTDPPKVAAPGDLACLLFTSGANGRPERAEVTRRTLADTLPGWRHLLGITTR
ncbi:MAG: AMP-binding protein, partial [Acidobacteriota bacterium]|nr:AMP-binding protein [Acidobacteriota bacterium]